jgi:hypothetical protein
VSGTDRLHRQDPERTDPLRQWAMMYRTPDSWNQRDPAPESAAAGAEANGESWQDVVAEGVAVGYRVIEEQISQGKRVAEQLSQASYGPAAMTGDVREATERLVRYSADLVALWMEFVNTSMANGDLLRTLSAAWPQPAAGAPPEATDAGAATAFAIEIASTHPVRVTFDLKSSAAGRRLATHGLRALEVEKPPLTEIAFETDWAGGPVALRLRVPEGQPPGLYTGVVIDQQSGEPLGTLTARLAE